jgi:hypothetical protein
VLPHCSLAKMLLTDGIASRFMGRRSDPIFTVSVPTTTRVLDTVVVAPDVSVVMLKPGKS